MQLFVLATAFFWAAVTALAQGSVEFSNISPQGAPPEQAQVNAPFFDNEGIPLSGPGYLAQLYAGSTEDSLAPFGVAVPFLTGSRAGYFAGTKVDLPGSIVAGYGGAVWVQVRAWEAVGGRLTSKPPQRAAGLAFLMSCFS